MTPIWVRSAPSVTSILRSGPSRSTRFWSSVRPPRRRRRPRSAPWPWRVPRALEASSLVERSAGTGVRAGAGSVTGVAAASPWERGPTRRRPRPLLRAGVASSVAASAAGAVLAATLAAPRWRPGPRGGRGRGGRFGGSAGLGLVGVDAPEPRLGGGAAATTGAGAGRAALGESLVGGILLRLGLGVGVDGGRRGGRQLCRALVAGARRPECRHRLGRGLALGGGRLLAGGMGRRPPAPAPAPAGPGSRPGRLLVGGGLHRRRLDGLGLGDRELSGLGPRRWGGGRGGWRGRPGGWRLGRLGRRCRRLGPGGRLARRGGLGRGDLGRRSGLALHLHWSLIPGGGRFRGDLGRHLGLGLGGQGGWGLGHGWSGGRRAGGTERRGALDGGHAEARRGGGLGLREQGDGRGRRGDGRWTTGERRHPARARGRDDAGGLSRGARSVPIEVRGRGRFGRLLRFRVLLEQSLLWGGYVR